MVLVMCDVLCLTCYASVLSFDVVVDVVVVVCSYAIRFFCCSEVDDDELRQLRNELSSLQVLLLNLNIYITNRHSSLAPPLPLLPPLLLSLPSSFLIFCRLGTTKKCGARRKRRRRGCCSSCRRAPLWPSPGSQHKTFHLTHCLQRMQQKIYK